MVTPQTTSRKVTARKLSGGKSVSVETAVIIEKELQIYINGTRLATASLAPGMEKEFVTGYLYGQGFIESVAGIDSLEIENNTAQITLKNKSFSPAAGTDYRIVSGGGRSAYFEDSTIKKIKSNLVIDKRDIFKAMNSLFQSAGLYSETEGAHAAGLFNASAEPLCLVEDIGRHNTLDKITGYILLNKIDASQVFLASTGRMASEMVTKICRCGIPIAATKTAVTDKGLGIARKCGLTLVGFVRDTGNRINTDMDVRIIKESGMKIYSGLSRICCE